MIKSRTNNSIKNTKYAIIGQGVGITLNFISRSVFISVLGTEYLGLNGLFSNILSMLSLAELGIGTAITYSLYEPLAKNDLFKIKALMNLFKNAYRLISIFIFIVGLLLIPFLDYFVEDGYHLNENIILIYLLFLINSSISYLLSYKRTLIIADQKKYLDTINRYTVLTILTLCQIGSLIITKNYLLFLIIQILFSIFENISISIIVNRIYPYIRTKEKVFLDERVKKEIQKNTVAMMAHKIGGILVNGTDNLIISKYLGLFAVGIYSNYLLIFNALNSLISQIFSSITASVGNLNATSDEKKSYEVFEIIYFMNFWIFSICSVCLMAVLNPFISIWIGEQYLLNKFTILILILNFYINGMRNSVNVFKNTYGLFWNDRYKSLIEAALNIIFSIILIQHYGITGVFIGTLISALLTNLWIEPYILFKYGFKLSPIKYFKKYLAYILITFLMAVIINWSVSMIIIDSIIILIFISLFIFIIVNILFFIIFWNDKKLKLLITLIPFLIKKEN